MVMYYKHTHTHTKHIHHNFLFRIGIIVQMLFISNLNSLGIVFMDENYGGKPVLPSFPSHLPYKETK